MTSARWRSWSTGATRSADCRPHSDFSATAESRCTRATDTRNGYPQRLALRPNPENIAKQGLPKGDVPRVVQHGTASSSSHIRSDAGLRIGEPERATGSWPSVCPVRRTEHKRGRRLAEPERVRRVEVHHLVAHPRRRWRRGALQCLADGGAAIVSAFERRQPLPRMTGEELRRRLSGVTGPDMAAAIDLLEHHVPAGLPPAGC